MGGSRSASVIRHASSAQPVLSADAAQGAGGDCRGVERGADSECLRWRIVESSVASESATSDDAPVATAVADSTGTPNAGSLSVDGAVDIDALEALADEFEVLDEEQQFDRLNEIPGNSSVTCSTCPASKRISVEPRPSTRPSSRRRQWLAGLAVEVRVASLLPNSNHRGSAAQLERKPTAYRASARACSAG